MKRMSKSVEKRIEGLGLDKADPESINIATDSLDGDTYVRPEVPPSVDLEVSEKDNEWVDSIIDSVGEGAEEYGKFSSEVPHSEGSLNGGTDKSRKKDFNDIGIDNEEGADYKKDIDIAIQLSPEEAYVTKKGNQVSHNNSEGLRIGGMNRGRKRDFSSSFGLNKADSESINNVTDGLDADTYGRPEVPLSAGLGLGGLRLRGDHMDVGEGSLQERILGPLGRRLRGYQKAVGEGSSGQRIPENLGLGLRDDHMNVGEGSSSSCSPGTSEVGLSGDYTDVGEGSSSSCSPGTSEVGSSGNHTDVGEGNSSSCSPGTSEVGSSGDHTDVGEGSSCSCSPGTLEVGLRGDRTDVGENSSRRHTQEETRSGQTFSPWPCRFQPDHTDTPELYNSVQTKPCVAFMKATEEGKIDMMYELYERELRKVAQQLARPADNIEPVTEAEEFGVTSDQFWEALMEIRARTSMTPAEQLIEWIPQTKIQDHGVASSFVPSILELSLEVFTKNASYLRKKLTDHTRKMNLDNFSLLLLQECPAEVRVKNCSWLTDDQFEHSLQRCQTENLRVLQLDLCGQITFQYAISNKLAQSSFSKLEILSLRGSLRLTNPVLELLVSSAPALQSINLGHCSLLTFTAVDYIAANFGESLRELYIDNCSSIKALQIEHCNCISKFKKLEVFSVAGLEDVSDEFISELVSTCGKTLLELDLADCKDLTNDSLAVIATKCPGLLALNISKLLKLTNNGLAILAEECRSIQRLNLTRTKFSDEYIAAFLEISGECLTKLSLNSVSQVGPNTALSLKRKSRKLSYLDISFCHGISNNALGLIVDSCLSLMFLKVFGCSQINDVFLHGHSNPLVRVVGFGSMSILDHINLLEPDELLLRYTELADPIDSWYQIIQQREGRT